MNALPEPSRLFELEDTIERGLATFVEVGQALLEIRDERHYHATHDTFEFYCLERWGFSDSRARQLIAAAETVTNVTVEGLPAPRTESVARELVPLRSDPPNLRETWSRVQSLHGPKPTAVQVREVVQDARESDKPALTRGQMANQKGGTDEWATPQDFFDVVNAEFTFDLDVCALASSAKCARYFTPETDGLAHEWTGTVWMNPPYGDVIAVWMKKAFESAQAGATVVCLVPARTDTGWFHDHAFPGEVRFIKGRLRFGEAEASAPFPSALVVLGPDVKKAAFDWSWR